MTIDDRVTISTPEGVDLELTLAGLGSRFIASLLDLTIQGAVILALAVVAGATGVTAGLGSGWAIALLSIGSFLVLFAYDLTFETLADGRTPGKRVNGLRVVSDDGSPVGFLASAVRNLLRIADFVPSLYVTGAFTIAASTRNQRLGDLAAGTLVVRERPGGRRAEDDRLDVWSATTTVDPAAVAHWDVSAITDTDLVAIRHFLARRIRLPPDARARLGIDLASRVAPRVGGLPSEAHPEYVLEGIVTAKTAR